MAAYSDPGHDAAEEEIRRLSKRLHVAYTRAYREMVRKAKADLERQVRADAEMAARVEAGEMTADELAAWRRGRAADATWYQQMVAELARDMARCDERAAAIVNGASLAVFAENANYGAFQVERAVDVDTSWTLVDADTVAGLARDHPDLLPQVSPISSKAEAWARRKITSAITQSVLVGDSVPAASRRLRSVVDMDERAATRAARTALTGAENAGRVSSYDRARGMGVDVRARWMATLDSRTRDSHRRLDGEVAGDDGKFSNGLRYPGDPTGPASEVWNCFVGETIAVPDGELQRSYRHEYSGDLVTLHTSAGVEVTCTPNHPILTPFGWVGAGFLHEGDHLLVTRLGDGEPPVRNPHVDHAPARIDALHELMHVLPGKRATVLGVDFHGDVSAAKVEVVSKEGLLRDDVDAGGNEGVRELLLEDAHALRPRLGSLPIPLKTVMRAASRLVRGLGIRRALGWSHRRHSECHGLASPARPYSGIPEDARHYLSAHPELLGDSLGGLPADVFADEVADVKIRPARGAHVYNLQTSSGRYFVNKKNNGIYIIAHNCRCTLVASMPGHDVFEGRDAHGLETSYEDWKAGRDPKRPRSADRTMSDFFAMPGTIARLNASGVSMAEARRRLTEQLREYGISSGSFRKMSAGDQQRALDAALARAGVPSGIQARVEGGQAMSASVVRGLLGRSVRLGTERGKGASDYVDMSGLGAEDRLTVRRAVAYVPTRMLRAIGGSGLKVTSGHETDRSAYLPGSNEVVLGEGADELHVVHELMHAVEEHDSEAMEAEREYFEERTRGRELKSLRELTGDDSYSSFEKAYDVGDGCIDPYAFKLYEGGGYELLSLGVEMLYREPLAFRRDPGMLKWLLDVLRG